MKSETSVTYNWHFSRDFPDLAQDLVERPHFLETIADILNSETSIVFLEGEEGGGATTLPISNYILTIGRFFSLLRFNERT